MRCETCQTELRPGEPAGLCAICALKALMTPEAQGEPTSSPPPKTFGNYQLLDELGRGGMGIVWRARQCSLNRLVAVKMAAGGGFAKETEIRRFRTEAEAAARLQHPNIVRIHEIGEVQGQPYFAMDYIEGTGLDEIARSGAISAERAARYMRDIAEAVHFAHEHGVVHRDLKPSNILIDHTDQPRVLDFGIARLLETDSSLTLTGQLLGSPSYMAPEQAAGRRGKLHRAADIYSLGAMLYHLVSGRPPFEGRSVAETLHQVQTTSPTPLRWVNRATPLDLETICFKCLEKDPKLRYETARELSRDLVLFLEGKPIRARRINNVEKGWRWCRRNPVPACLTAMLLLTGCLFVGVVIRQAHNEVEFERRRRIEAEALQKKADEAAEFAIVNAYEADISAAAVLAVEDPERARDLLRRYERNESADLRGFEWGHLWLKTTPVDSLELLTNAAPVRYILPLGDSAKFLLVTPNWYEIWDAAQLRPVWRHDPDETEIWDASITSDGRTIATCIQDTVSLQEVSTGKIKASIEVPGIGRIRPALWPDGKLLALASLEGVEVRSLENDSELLQLDGVFGDVVISPDGQWLAALGKSRRHIHIFSGKTLESHGSVDFDFTTGLGGPSALVFSKDSRLLAAGNRVGLVSIWNVSSITEIARLKNHPGVIVNTLTFSLDGKYLAIGSHDHVIRIASTANADVETVLQGHTSPVTGLLFLSGSKLLSASEDGQVRLWSLAASAAAENFSIPHPLWINSDGSAYVRAHPKKSDLEFQIMELSTSNVLAQIRIPRVNVGVWNVSRNLAWAAVLTPGGKLQIFDILQGVLRQDATLAIEHPAFINFAIDNKALFVANEQGTIEVRHVPSLHLLSRLKNTRGVTHMFGDFLIGYAGDDRKTIVVRDANGGTIISTLSGHAGAIASLDTSWDGKYLATASEDGSVKVWTLPEGRLIHTLPGQRAGSHIVQFSPDSKTLAVAGLDGGITFWSLRTGRQLLAVKGRGHLVELLFSRDGRALAAYRINRDLSLLRASEY
jgi:eukaryotic-like serine/threonine-protein kinase